MTSRTNTAAPIADARHAIAPGDRPSEREQDPSLPLADIDETDLEDEDDDEDLDDEEDVIIEDDIADVIDEEEGRTGQT